jgi:hypothetical protein
MSHSAGPWFLLSEQESFSDWKDENKPDQKGIKTQGR